MQNAKVYQRLRGTITSDFQDVLIVGDRLVPYLKTTLFAEPIAANSLTARGESLVINRRGYR